MGKIASITCHKVVNSRGDWTIETHLKLNNGVEASQTIPDGASTGENEVHYIPVDKSVEIVSTVINDALIGEDSSRQLELDEMMLQMDGTPNLKNLGGNSLLSVSLALAKATAQDLGIELFQYIRQLYFGKKSSYGNVFPIPLFNVVNGGKHAQDNLTFQEFMVIPAPQGSFMKYMEIGMHVYHSLRNKLLSQNYATGVGDEGGFAPKHLNAHKALELIKSAVEEKYISGKDVFYGMDCAAGSFFTDNHYVIAEENHKYDAKGLLKYYSELLKKFEIMYIEDPFYETDFAGWKIAFYALGKSTLICGDDLVVTNPQILSKIIPQKLINCVIVKPNQVGTLSDTLKFIREAKNSGYKTVVSHRSGDTAEDTFIADLAFGVQSDFIKAGSPVRGERVAKYNRLLEIERIVSQ